MEKTNLIFDFDGVIGDSLPVLVRIGNGQFGHYLCESLSVELIRTKGVRAFIKGYKMGSLRLLLWIWKAQKLLAKERIPIVHRIDQVLKTFYGYGFSLQLVSSGGRRYITNVLDAHGCSKLFGTIQTNIGMFKKSKYIQTLASKHPGQSVYVGDEVRDIEAAHKAGIQCVSVTWGYESRELLQQANPDYLVDSPEELIQAIERLGSRTL